MIFGGVTFHTFRSRQVFELAKKNNHSKAIAYFRSLGCYKEEDQVEADAKASAAAVVADKETRQRYIAHPLVFRVCQLLVS